MKKRLVYSQLVLALGLFLTGVFLVQKPSTAMALRFQMDPGICCDAFDTPAGFFTDCQIGGNTCVENACGLGGTPCHNDKPY